MRMAGGSVENGKKMAQKTKNANWSKMAIVWADPLNLRANAAKANPIPKVPIRVIVNKYPPRSPLWKGNWPKKPIISTTEARHSKPVHIKVMTTRERRLANLLAGLR